MNSSSEKASLSSTHLTPVAGPDEVHSGPLARVIDESKTGAFQYFVYALCFVALMIDGFDAYSVAYVAPLLRAELRISPVNLGLAFSASLVGMLVGSIALSWLSDCIGRRVVTIGALFLSGGMMLWTGAAESYSALVFSRFSTGLGLGVLLPNALAICSEFAPARRRFIVLMLIGLGISAGAAPGGVIAAKIFSLYGWRAVFEIGGGVSIAFAFLLLIGLPESPEFAICHFGSSSATVQRTVRLLLGRSRAAQFDWSNYSGPVVQRRVRVGTLFENGLRTATLVFWTITFCNLLCLYFLGNWLPTLIRDRGFALSDAVLASSAMQLGGLPGALAINYFVRRYPVAVVLAAWHLLGAVAIFSVGLAASAGLGAILIASFVVGVGVIGGQTGTQAVAMASYPRHIHSSGIGWALGVGRLGSILGPFLAGLLLSLGWSSQSVFQAAALAGILASLSSVVLAKTAHELPSEIEAQA